MVNGEGRNPRKDITIASPNPGKHSGSVNTKDSSNGTGRNPQKDIAIAVPNPGGPGGKK